MNEVEVFLAVVEKMVKGRAKENPTGGIKVSSDCKMKYNEMLEVLKRLKSFTENWGSMELYSICKECENYYPTSECYGRCQNLHRKPYAPDSVHCYNTCWENTSRRTSTKK